MGMDDFQALGEGSAKRQRMAGNKADKGEPRDYLKVFENLPAQMLNVYGRARYDSATDATVWRHCNEPLPTGAKFMTEWCSKEDGRRGVANNRWIMPLLNWCVYQEGEEVKAKNKFIMNPTMFNELYAEFAKVMDSLEYCLAPKKDWVKKGAAGIRSSVGVAPASMKDPVKLKENAKILYELLDTSKVSRIRMLLHWQGSGGLSYVTSVYHRVAQVWRYHGNTFHDASTGNEVSLAEFQDAICSRHMDETPEEYESVAQNDLDFKNC